MHIFKFLFFLLLLLMISVSTFNCTQLQETHNPEKECSGNSTATDGIDMFPLIDQKKVEMMMVMNETRRKLGSFQICAPCTCCGRGYCLPSPCCYAINCNIPNRPFGFCSFTPRTCHCFHCHF